MALWPFSNLFPGTNYDRENLDWIMQTLKSAADSVAASEQASRDSAAAIQTAEEAKEIATQAATGVIVDGAVTWVKLAAAVQQIITDLQASLAALTGRVTNNESAITSQASAISDLETTDTQMLSSIDTLSGAVTSQGGRITSNSNSINQQASQIGDLDSRVSALETGGSGGTTEMVTIGPNDRQDGVTLTCSTAYKMTRGVVEIFFDFFPKNSGGVFTTLFTLPENMRPVHDIIMPVWIINVDQGTAANRWIAVYSDGRVGYSSQGSGEYNRFYWHVSFPAPST